MQRAHTSQNSGQPWSRFDTIEELRLALNAFKDTYNRAWIVERHGYQTPAAVKATQLTPLPAAA